MKLYFPELSTPISITEDAVSALVIENQALFHKIVFDLSRQIDGHPGEVALFCDDAPVSIAKYVDLTTSIIPFDLNRKPLVNKIISYMERTAIDPSNFERTQQLLSDIENYVTDLSFDAVGEIECDKLTVSSLLKAIGVRIYEDADTTLEKIVNYMELVREYDRERLFVFVNLRSFFSDSDVAEFVKTVATHKYRVLLLDSFSRPFLPSEIRTTIDDDLCEIG